MKEKQTLSSCAPVIEADRGRPQEAPSDRFQRGYVNGQCHKPSHKPGRHPGPPPVRDPCVFDYTFEPDHGGHLVDTVNNCVLVSDEVMDEIASLTPASRKALFDYFLLAAEPSTADIDEERA